MKIDIVAESLDNKFLLFGEVKWKEKPNSENKESLTTSART